MRNEILLLLFVVMNIPLYSQLKIEAGSDKVFCLGFEIKDSLEDAITPSPILKSTDTLGGSPTISGGHPPYKYRWYMFDPPTSTHVSEFPASHYLDDTTQANPVLKRKFFQNTTTVIYVEVTDSIGNKNLDSVQIEIVHFMAHGIDNEYKLSQDTVKKCDFISPASFLKGGTTYHWKPNYYISDSTEKCPKFWPPIDTIYYLNVIDTFGCESGYIKAFNIFITDDMGQISQIDKNNIFSNLHCPITSTSAYFFQNTTSEKHIEIYNLSGQLVYTQKHRKSIKIGNILIKKGVYFLKVRYENESFLFKISVEQ